MRDIDNVFACAARCREKPLHLFSGHRVERRKWSSISSTPGCRPASGDRTRCCIPRELVRERIGKLRNPPGTEIPVQPRCAPSCRSVASRGRIRHFAARPPREQLGESWNTTPRLYWRPMIRLPRCGYRRLWIRNPESISDRRFAATLGPEMQRNFVAGTEKLTSLTASTRLRPGISYS